MRDNLTNLTEDHGLLVGRTALIVVDIQQGGSCSKEESGISQMPGWAPRLDHGIKLVHAARLKGIPVIFLQEVHRQSGVDFGRELDGTEGKHCLEGDPNTDFFPQLRPRTGEHHIIKRRYSGFFATELDLLLRSLRVETVILIGGLTDVCVQYTFVDAHQHDYHVRVAYDAVGGSTLEAHDAALRAMAYLQRTSIQSSATLIAALERHRAGVSPQMIST